MLMSEDMQMERLSKLFVLIVIVVCVVKNGGEKETCYNQDVESVPEWVCRIGVLYEVASIQVKKKWNQEMGSVPD